MSFQNPLVIAQEDEEKNAFNDSFETEKKIVFKNMCSE